MTSVVSPAADSPFATLRRFARPRSPMERCELCSAGLSSQHSHLLELATRKILCACEPCSTLFDGMTGGRYKRVSRRIWLLQDFEISDMRWEEMMIPINMAFFIFSRTEKKTVALYPSPAGAIESQLPLYAWDEMVNDNPILKEMEPDVEALLVNRIGRTSESAPSDYYLAPIDECFGLVGLIRAHWKGLSGGSEVWTEIANFFSALKARAEIISGGEPNA